MIQLQSGLSDGYGGAFDMNMIKAMQRLKLPARAYHHTLRVARTLADLAGAERPGAAHIAEAVQYRRGLDGR